MALGPKPRNVYGHKKYKEDLTQSSRDLTQAVNARLPSNDKPYGQAAVLALHWENDDLNVAGLEEEFLSVFRKTYGFNVESYVISAHGQASLELSRKTGEFVTKWDGKDGLTIYVYSGHAEEGGDPDGTLLMLR
jgi:hypothetical protein